MQRVENSTESVGGEVRNRTVDALERAGCRRYVNALRGHLDPRTGARIVPEKFICGACKAQTYGFDLQFGRNVERHRGIEIENEQGIIQTHGDDDIRVHRMRSE